jgi:hypothetical protein
MLICPEGLRKTTNLNQESQCWSNDSKFNVGTFDYGQMYSIWVNFSTEQKKEVGYKRS